MKEQDIKQIADLVKNVFDSRFERFEGDLETRLDKRFERFEGDLEARQDRRSERFEGALDARQNQRFERFLGELTANLDARFETFRGEINGDFAHQMSIQREDFQHKLDLVVEGQQMLAEKLDATRDELKADIAQVDHRVTLVAADLAAHRRDTEAHRRGWRVREDEE